MDNEQLLDRVQTLLLGMEERVNVRFDKVDTRLDGMDARLNGMDARRWSHRVEDESHPALSATSGSPSAAC